MAQYSFLCFFRNVVVDRYPLRMYPKRGINTACFEHTPNTSGHRAQPEQLHTEFPRTKTNTTSPTTGATTQAHSQTTTTSSHETLYVYFGHAFLRSAAGVHRTQLRRRTELTQGFTCRWAGYCWHSHTGDHPEHAQCIAHRCVGRGGCPNFPNVEEQKMSDHGTLDRCLGRRSQSVRGIGRESHVSGGGHHVHAHWASTSHYAAGCVTVAAASVGAQGARRPRWPPREVSHRSVCPSRCTMG